MYRLLVVLCGALMLLRGGMASATELPAAATAAVTAPTPLFVELVVNGEVKGDIVEMQLRGDHPIVAAADLAAAGVSLDASGEVDLASTPGIHAAYDALGQRLVIDADPALLPTSRIAGAARQRAQTVSDSGALLNYDLYLQTSGGRTSASLWSEQRLFGDLGSLSNTGTLRISAGHTSSSGYLRYDTRFRYIDEHRAVAVTAGDLITQSQPWTRSVRLGGVQIARNFQVRPDLLTMPLPSFAGQSAVPSTVDLFVNGYRQQSTKVAPGRFVLDNLPVVNGAGEATIVTTDAVGRQVATTIPFYVSSELLRPGLIDGSIEAGALRRSYGLRSFAYGPAAASGTLRVGLTPKLTVEGHGEATRGLGLLGAGVTAAPGHWGVFDLAVAASHARGRTAAQLTAGYSYGSRRFSVAVQHMERSDAYRDLAGFDLAAVQGARRSDRMVVTAALPGHGSLGLAAIAGRTITGTRTRLATLSWSRPIGRLASLFVGADHDLIQHTTSAQLRLLVPFGRNSVSAGASHSKVRGTLGQLDYQRSIPTDGGLGIAASLAAGEDGIGFGQASAQWRGRAVDVQVGGAFANGRSSAWAGASGTLVVLDRSVYAANQVSDAFAVVSTGGVARVPISYENQKVGRTDARGRLFVPGITAYHAGRFALDPLSLDVGLTAVSVERRVALRQGVGAVIHLDIQRSLNVTVPITDAGGAPLAPGGVVRRAGDRTAEIGWDGLVFLDDVAQRETLEIVRHDGGRCRADVIVPAGTQALATMDPVPCV